MSLVEHEGDIGRMYRYSFCFTFYLVRFIVKVEEGGNDYDACII